MRGPRYLTSLGWLLLTASALGVWCQRRSPGYYFPLAKEPAIASRLAQKVTIPQTEFSLPELVAQLAEWAQVEMSVEEPLQKSPYRVMVQANQQRIEDLMYGLTRLYPLRWEEQEGRYRLVRLLPDRPPENMSAEEQLNYLLTRIAALAITTNSNHSVQRQDDAWHEIRRSLYEAVRRLPLGAHTFKPRELPWEVQEAFAEWLSAQAEYFLAGLLEGANYDPARQPSGEETPAPIGGPGQGASEVEDGEK